MKSIGLRNSRFFELYSTQLQAWCRELESSTDPILAIARKGPRLLELLVRAGFLSPDVLERVTTQRALPFLNESSNKLIVLDDILTYGSTFSRVCELASKLFAIRNSGNALSVKGIPFGLCQTVPDAYRSRIARHFLDLRYDEVCQFVHAEMDAFRLLGKPIEIENPALTCYGDFVDPARVDLCVSLIARDLKGSVVRLHHEVLLERKPHRTYGWLIVLDPDDHISTVYPPEFRLVRVYRNFEGTELRWVAIRQCALDANTWQQLIECLPARLQSLGRHCSITSRSSDTIVDRAAGRSFAMWANYLKKAMMLGEMQQTIKTNVASVLSAFAWHGPTVQDLRLLVGRNYADEAFDELQKYFTDAEREKRPLAKLPNVDPLSERMVGEKYPERYERQYRSTVALLLDKAVNVHEIVEAVFHAQHIAIDLPSRNLRIAPHSRLEFGIRFRTLCDTVRSRLPATSDTEILAAVARLIDDGVVVPRHADMSKDDSPIWCRVYRVGEGMPPRRVQTISLLYTKLKDALGPNTTAIPALLFEKYCVLVFDVAKNIGVLTALQNLEVRKGFDLFGAREMFAFAKRPQYITDWAIHKSILFPQDSSSIREDRQGYRLSLDLATTYPTAEVPWDKSVQRSIRNVAHFAAFLHGTDGLKSDALVTLTSVATPEELFHAIEAELDLWINHPRFSIYQATRALLDYSSGRHIFREPSQVNDILAGAANYMAQVAKKIKLAEDRQHCFTKIDEAIKSRDQALQDFWMDLSDNIKGRLTFEGVPLGHDKIVSALRIARRSTSLLRDLLTASGFSPADERTPRPLQESISRILAEIEGVGSNACDPAIRPIFELNRNGREGIPAQILALRDSSLLGSFSTAVRPICDLVEDIAGRCEEVLLSYGAQESLDGPVELTPPRFVLLWDVRGSSDSSDNTPLHRSLAKANDLIKNTLSGAIVSFNPLSLDDGNSLITKDFKTIIIAFKILHEVLAESSFGIRAGCAVNLEGGLQHYPKSGRLGGKAYEAAARVRDFYKEAGDYPNRWHGSVPESPGAGQSYLLVHEFAFRYAGDYVQTLDGWDIERLDGRYTPRVAGALAADVFLLKLNRPNGETTFTEGEAEII